VAIVGYNGEVIGRPSGSLNLQLHSTFTPNTCSMGHSKRISWGLVSRIPTIACPCKWQSQEQLPLQRSCSPMEQTTVLEPGYGQLVLILVPPSENRQSLKSNRAHCEEVPACTTPRLFELVSVRGLPPRLDVIRSRLRPPHPRPHATAAAPLEDCRRLRAEPLDELPEGLLRDSTTKSRSYSVT
jgi:hypothetical protein